jgi:hypothetical protein
MYTTVGYKVIERTFGKTVYSEILEIRTIRSFGDVGSM